ncbi:MAG TPA: RodZ domain-containing protein [Elusimicrobiota bacterium]|nr:RodZ domain-containing protein [Elusimicrobiota bacterium]
MTAGELAVAGDALKRARLKKGESLEDAARQTRVPRKFLAALEDGRIDDFPAPVYAEGFFNIYSEHLGLSKASLRGEGAANSEMEKPETPTAKMDNAHAGEEISHAENHAAPRGSDSYRLLMTASIAVLAAFAIWLWHASSSMWLPKRPAEAVPADAAAPQAAAFPAKVDLTIIFHHEVWLRVLVDGKPAFAGRVPKGGMREWKARKNVVLETGDPRAFDLMVNGAPYSIIPNMSERYLIRAR